LPPSRVQPSCPNYCPGDRIARQAKVMAERFGVSAALFL
jgi:hypothetical protein